ncbi:Transcriptional activator protein acu-15 [Leucoagaricus sp. SymC.cos]|nr:Transcriptional activator protein acu-15 [Leucoagaricus sp. SymC.cos]
MSSNEDEYNDHEGGLASGLKKRRIQRACDICRRKKSICVGNGVQMPGNRCSNCITYNFECTYIETAKKRGPPKGYVESLENRLEKLEKLLKRLCPDEKLLRELDIAIDKEDFPLDQPPIDPSPLVTTAAKQDKNDGARSVVDIATSVLRRYGSAAQDADERFEDDAHLILADNLKQLSLDPKEYRFFGKSSGAMLIQTAIELKNEYTGKSPPPNTGILGLKRNEFWTSYPWEDILKPTTTQPHYKFPEPDLLHALVDLYFEYINLFVPLLHRPTFERSIAEGLHHHDERFGANVLLVCANGSRFSDDPRVLLDGEKSRHSSGWKWFDQVQMVKRSFLNPPTLYDLQFYSVRTPQNFAHDTLMLTKAINEQLSVLFLQGTSAPQACWAMAGVGIRLAQDVGAHRKRKTNGPMTVEDELWKRAFWVLACIDRGISAALGRPCAIHDEDFDVDLPVECDDEYWEHPDPEKRWKQPPGKPSLVSAFLCYLKLNQVLAFSLRTIYSINKSKILLGFVGDQWEQHIVAELDSALNHFVDTVPDHLRWDPNREDKRFFNQSVVLWSLYYHIQILIHRPFIPTPSKPSPLSFPSLAICTNAARSCIHVVNVQIKRVPLPNPQVQMAVFTAGIVLLLSIWGGKKSGLSTDPSKEMADVHKCMAVLKGCEARWHSAGRLWDILYELASVGDLPLPQGSPPSNKRERDSDSPISSTTSDHTSTPPPSSDGSRTFAGSKRVNKELSSLMLDPSSSTMGQQSQELYTLPLYSDELGRLPLHGQVKFSPQAQASLSSSSSHPHSHVLEPHLTHHIPNHQPVDPGGLWYSFEQAQMRGFQSFSMGPPDDPLMGPGASTSSGLGGNGVPGPSLGDSSPEGASQAEADFIFNQLAMGYPAASYTPDMQPGGMILNGMGMGMLGGQGMRGNEMVQHYGDGSTSGVGTGLGGDSTDQQRQHGYMDSDTMTTLWSAGPGPGFE